MSETLFSCDFFILYLFFFGVRFKGARKSFITPNLTIAPLWWEAVSDGQWINAHMWRSRLAVMWISVPPCCPVSWIMSIIPASLSFGVGLKGLLSHYRLMSHAAEYTFTATWWGLPDTYWHPLPDTRMRRSVCSHTRTASTWSYTGAEDERECEHMCVCAHELSLILSINHSISQSRQGCQAELAGGPADRC